MKNEGEGNLKQSGGSDAFQKEVAGIAISAKTEEEITAQSTSPAGGKSAADRRYFLRFMKNHARAIKERNEDMEIGIPTVYRSVWLRCEKPQQN